ncbi:hypothetical protein A2U01_0109399, partial [Trifolium medium]|nr:hypothetical protein [Trifolium medium]
MEMFLKWNVQEMSSVVRIRKELEKQVVGTFKGEVVGPSV